MDNITDKISWTPGLKILRWSARIIAILVAAFILLMFLGEGIGNRALNARPLEVRDYFFLSLWALYAIGLIIGLWWEGLGGWISFGIITINIIILQTESVNSPIFLYLLVPGILYILSWYFQRKQSLKLKQ